MLNNIISRAKKSDVS